MLNVYLLTVIILFGWIFFQTLSKSFLFKHFNYNRVAWMNELCQFSNFSGKIAHKINIDLLKKIVILFSCYCFSICWTCANLNSNVGNYSAERIRNISYILQRKSMKFLFIYNNINIKVDLFAKQNINLFALKPLRGNNQWISCYAIISYYRIGFFSFDHKVNANLVCRIRFSRNS